VQSIWVYSGPVQSIQVILVDLEKRAKVTHLQISGSVWSVQGYMVRSSLFGSVHVYSSPVGFGFIQVRSGLFGSIQGYIFLCLPL
jgi:hypothetical protein